MKKLLSYAMLASLSLGTMSASASFDINVIYNPAGVLVDSDGDGILETTTTDAFSDRQKQLFGAAETFWESMLTDFQGITDATYDLTAWLTSEDGFSGSLAFAGPRTEQTLGSGIVRATSGIMQFDADDFGTSVVSPQSEQLFLDSAIHEIAHALGFGTMFDANSLVSGNNFTGTNAVDTFNDDYGSSITSIALQPGGGHWDECWIETGLGFACDPEDGSPTLGLFNDVELMTPFAVDTATISATTIAAFRDLGYLTIDPFTPGIVLPLAANITFDVSAPAAGSLLLVTLLGFYVSGRRRCS